MCARIVRWAVVIASLLWSHVCLAEIVLFENNFEDALSSKWQVVDLKKTDYRLRRALNL